MSDAPRFTVTVHGTPATQGSKTRVGRRIVNDNAKRLDPWREAVRSEVQRAIKAGAVPFVKAEPVHMVACFFFRRPAKHFRANGALRPDAPARPTYQQDVEKLVRAVSDACTDGGAWHDDGQVVSLSAAKFWADERPPGCSLALSITTTEETTA